MLPWLRDGLADVTEAPAARGHDNTRRRMLTNVMEQFTYLNSVQPVPARVEALKQRIAQEADPQQKAALERQVTNSLAYLEQVENRLDRAEDRTALDQRRDDDAARQLVAQLALPAAPQPPAAGRGLPGMSATDLATVTLEIDGRELTVPKGTSSMAVR
jgi:hypothetical protein